MLEDCRKLLVLPRWLDLADDGGNSSGKRGMESSPQSSVCLVCSSWSLTKPLECERGMRGCEVISLYLHRSLASLSLQLLTLDPLQILSVCRSFLS